MVDAELGTKRNCPSCAGRFYDLNNDPITCPLCSETFVVEPILPSKADSPAPSAPAPVAEEVKPAVVDPVTAVDDDDDDKDDVDDAVAGIEDVDLDDDAEAIGGDDDNTFLDTEDDDDGNVTDIVAPVVKGEEET